MSAARLRVLTLNVTERLVTETCSDCGVLYAMDEELQQNRLSDKKTFYCPNGHGQHYTGPSDTQKLQQAEARETALRDQLEASIRDGERTRQAMARDRQRIANGVCPCCNRSFENVRRHMATKHPDYDVTTVALVRFECGCGRKFDTFHGLRVHQARARSKDWSKPGASAYRSHLTVGATS